MNGRADVVVIGATVAGLTSAIQLRRHGMRITILDPNAKSESVVAGHGVVSPAGALTGVAEERPPHDLGGYVAASAFVEKVASDAQVDVRNVSLTRRTVDRDAEPVSGRLRESGIRLVQVRDQPLPGLNLRPGWSAKEALLVDPVAYAGALTNLALALGVEIIHDATVTRFRHFNGFHTVAYRSQIAWQDPVRSVVAPRQIDTMGVSPWGRVVTGGTAQLAPILLAKGVALDQVIVTPDSPAHVIRPHGDGVLISGHAVSPPALETAAVGLAAWVGDKLGLEVGETGGFGVQPTPAQDPRVGAAAIPGAFWAGGHGMWELTRGTASGLWLSERLLRDGSGSDRLPLPSRIRARVFGPKA